VPNFARRDRPRHLVALVPDLAPANGDFCTAPPTVVGGLTPQQKAACVAALRGSQVHQTACP
jgi:hypothetical protein